MIDYGSQIMREVDEFEHAYNKSPSAIFMSYGLYRIFVACYPYNFAFSKSQDVMFGNIPVKIYNSDKIEYYLAESGFELPQEGGD